MYTFNKTTIFKKSLEKYIGIEKKLLSQILKILVTTVLEHKVNFYVFFLQKLKKYFNIYKLFQIFKILIVALESIG